MKISVLILLCVAVMSGFSAQASADEFYTFIVKKQEEKAPTRWSLSEWLHTRDQVRLMDMWLAMHTPSPYEFFFGADYRFLDRGPGSPAQNFRLNAAAFATIFGLEGQHGFSPGQESLGIFDFRVFGYHSQGTNITLQGGIRSADGVRQALAGLDTTLYLARFFGVSGVYRHYFTPAGTRYELNAFIDFSFLRVYGGYYSETIAAGQSGVNLGTRLYF